MSEEGMSLLPGRKKKMKFGRVHRILLDNQAEQRIWTKELHRQRLRHGRMMRLGVLQVVC